MLAVETEFPRVTVRDVHIYMEEKKFLPILVHIGSFCSFFNI